MTATPIVFAIDRHKQIVYIGVRDPLLHFFRDGTILCDGESDMTIRNGLSPIHPGEFLKEGLDELGTSQTEFARVIGVSPMRISHIVNGARPVTAELALLIGRAFGQSPQYWLNLQTAFDLKIAEQEIRSRLRAMRPLAHA
jgi:addiction module HigA family antidote